MTLSLGLFAPHVGDTFTIYAADGAIEAELVSAEPGTPVPGGAAEPFSLLWLGPPAPQLQQGLHVVTHPALEPAEIFLVPVGPQGDAVQYQAIFS